MGGWNEVTKTDTAAPFVLTIERDGVGGVPGLIPTVRLRDPAVAGSYYDWTDNTFKSAGWGLRDAPMSDVGGGHYQRAWNPSTFPLAAGATFVAEYAIASPPFVGADAELFLLSNLRPDATLVRQYHTNRMHETGGNPGTLTLFADDDVSVLRTHQLRDEAGGPIASTVQTPARRSKGA